MMPVDFTQVVEELRARPLEVAQRYAPGGYVDKGKYWALNPMRNDRSIGSFYINLAGPHAGRFFDHATGDGGDMLDLIQGAIGSNRRGALDEAIAFLGLGGDLTPQQQRLRDRQAARARAAAERSRQDAEQDVARKRRRAHAMWLHAQPDLSGTPVAEYLANRGIGLAQLGHSPGCIRFHPALPYKEIDKETGEIFEGEYPAMVTAIHGPADGEGIPAFWSVHRTWLAPLPDGSIWTAPVPKAKKCYGSPKGGFMRLWRGRTDGKMNRNLSKAGDSLRVFVTEGIEDGLSVALTRPEARVLCAYSVGNFAEMVLPPQVSHVTLVADNDGPEGAKALEKALARLTSQGRKVDVWRNDHGGKDLNDAVMAAQGISKIYEGGQLVGLQRDAKAGVA